MSIRKTFLNEKIFNYSVNFLREEIERMKKIGLETIVLHPGNALKAEPKKACLKLAEGLNLILKKNTAAVIFNLN